MVQTREERNAENEKFIGFICEQCGTAEQPLNLKNLVTDFVEKEGSDRTVAAFCKILNDYKNKEVFEIEDRETRVRQFFALGVQINETLLTELREHAEVNLDGAGRITEYEARDGRLTMVRTKGEREKENEKLLKFISERCENADEPLNIFNVVKDYIDKEGTNTAHRTLISVVGNYKNKGVFETENRETRVRQLFGLGVGIDDAILTELREHASVDLDRVGRITKYEAYDGHLTLHGNHCNRKKHQETMAERRRSQMAADEAGNEEEEEEDDGDRFNVAVDPELEPPAPKRPRVEHSGHSSGNVRPPTSNRFENFPGPGLENVKEEVPDHVFLNLYGIKIENPEDTEAFVPQMNAVKTEEPDTSFAPDSVTPRQSTSAARIRNLASALPASESSPVTQPPASTDSAVNPLTASEQLSTPTVRRQQNPPVAHEIITSDDDEDKDVKPVITSTSAPAQPSAPSSRNRDQENSRQQSQTINVPIRPVLSLSNHQSFLQQTKALITTMKLPVDKTIENRITGMIDRIRSRQQDIQQTEIYFFEGTIRHAISLALVNTSKVIQDEDSRSFVQFVLLLQMNIVGLNEPKLKGLEDTVHEICQRSDYQQKKISVSCIEKALESILDIIAPN